jgi:hypothetical protein
MDRTRRMRSARNKGASSRRLSPNNRAQRAPVFFAAVRAQSAAKPSADGRWSRTGVWRRAFLPLNAQGEQLLDSLRGGFVCCLGVALIIGFGAWAWAGVRGVGAAGRGWVI